MTGGRRLIQINARLIGVMDAAFQCDGVLPGRKLMFSGQME